MKRTINININGNAFQIEEDAYSRLKNYLNAIEKRIQDPLEAREVIADIEARMAELMRMNCKTSAEIVTEEIVAEVIKVIGEPKDITGEEETNPQEPPSQPIYTQTPIFSKKMYRDTDDRVIAGVCGGLAYYFNTSAVIVRLIFVLLVLTGVSPLVYLIFWIVMPKALTVAQRMEMMGPGYQNRVNTLGDSKSGQSPINDNLTEVATSIGRIVATVFGVVLSLVSFLMLTTLVMSLLFFPQFTTHTNSDWGFVTMLPQLLLPNGLLPMASLALLLLIGIPLLMLFYWGICLTFNIQKRSKWIGIIVFLIWLGSLGVLIYSGIIIGKEFLFESTTTKDTEIKTNHYKTLYLKATQMPGLDDEQNHLIINHLKLFTLNDALNIQGEPQIEIYRSNEAKITIQKSALGSDKTQSEINAEGAEYFWVQRDSILQLDRHFTLANNTLIRNQKVKVTLLIPNDINLVIDEELKEIVEYR
jgi:phage shock protein PspC (stress-responsive transcriptional regulator)